MTYCAPLALYMPAAVKRLLSAPLHMQCRISCTTTTCRRESGLHEAHPYFSPLLEPPTLPSAAPATVMGSSMPHTRTDKSKGQGKKEAVANLLSDMSMADAVQCITQFLRCDKR